MVVLMAAFCTCVLCYFFMDTHPKKKVEKKKNLISVGFAQVGAESDWRTANSISIKKTFAESKGYDLLFEDARQMQENQIKSMREFIQQDVDYIVVAPVIEEGFETVLEEASRAKIPVIVIDRKVSVSDNNLYTTWIGSDFYLQGKKACECLNQYITQKGMKDVNIVNIQGTLGSTSQIGRSNALNEACSKYGWNLVAQEPGDYTQAKSKEVMKNILQKTKDIDFVYCENDNEAFGAIEAIKEAGLSVGVNGGINIVSFDATKGGLKRTLSGEILFDVECNPLQGPVVDNVIKMLEEGKIPKKEYYVKEQVFVHDSILNEITVDGTKYDLLTVTDDYISERVY